MTIRVDRSLSGSLAGRADGRVLVIDNFRSWSCGIWVGDLTVVWSPVPSTDEFTELVPLEGVAVYARRRLVRLLDAAGPTINRNHLSFFGGLRIALDRPELWIDYLDRPQAWAPVSSDVPGPAA